MTMTRGERIIEFVRRYCKIPEGALIGQPMELLPFQRKFILDVYDNPHGTRRGILSIARKNGKALALNTPIPTIGGWKTMEELKVGDFVFGSDGKPTKVTFVSEIFTDKDCYRLSFSDGSEVIASADHQWLTTHKFRPWQKPGKGQEGGFNRAPVSAVVTTEQISQSIKIVRGDGGNENNHSIALNGEVQFEPIDLPIHPYLLGVWLGDGKSTGASITVGSKDAESMMLNVRPIWPSANYRKKDSNGNKTLSLSIPVGSGRKTKSFKVKLRNLGLTGDKKIPEMYLMASVEQRLDLLRGLLDTDGTVNKCGGRYPRVSFCNTNYDLAYGFWRLARSLGFKAKIISKIPTLNGVTCNKAYLVEFAADNSRRIFNLERKQKLLPPSIGKRSKTIKIIDCVPVGKVPCKCIAVEAADSLFLCGHGCIVTHNTALTSALLLAHIIGPEAKRNTQIVSGAGSRDQAALVFDLAVKMIRLNPKLESVTKIVPSGKRIYGLPMNVEFKALSAEGRTAHGLSPVLAILDETGQVQGPRDPFIEAIVTSQGAHANPLLLTISTQAAHDGDLLSLWIDDALTGADPHTICHLYAAPHNCELMDEAAWAAANPGLGEFRNKDDIRTQLQQAQRMPSMENTVRNLLLNQRVSTSSPFVSRGAWEACARPPAPLAECEEIFGGLDLSARTDLTALVLLGYKAGSWHAHPFVWTPESGLEERAKRDRTPYDVWAKQGFLRTTPGATIDYEFIAKQMQDICGPLPNVTSIGYDRWRIDILKKELERLGVEMPLTPWGQGYYSMSPALDALESFILNKTLCHGSHPLLNMAAANTIVGRDSAGNRKPEKDKSTGRIDPLVALAMAAGLADKLGGQNASFDSFISNPLILR